MLCCDDFVSTVAAAMPIAPNATPNFPTFKAVALAKPPTFFRPLLTEEKALPVRLVAVIGILTGLFAIFHLKIRDPSKKLDHAHLCNFVYRLVQMLRKLVCKK
jgi:hypothetical protein